MARISLRLQLETLVSFSAAISASFAMNARAAMDAESDDNFNPQITESQAIDFGRPCPQACCEVNASLLFLQPSGGDLEYGTLVSPLPAPTPNWRNEAIDPEHSLAFNVGMRYFVSECHNDIELNWTHLDSSDHDSFVAAPNQFVGPPFEIGPDASSFRLANGEVHFEYDAVNLDAGHVLNAGGPVEVRVFGGVQFARVSDDLTGTFESFDHTTSNANTTESLFTGVGPRLGMKAESNTGHLQFLGEIAASALVGTMQSRMDFFANSPSLAGLGITPPNTQSLTSPDATRVVPSLDTKLGSSYTLPCTRYGLFKFEAGYQAAIYVNAVNQYSLTEVVTPPVTQSVGVFLRTVTPLQSDFTVHGPYMTASWVF
jgi:Legionella pneumophila major outer membrane protein precursor